MDRDQAIKKLKIKENQNRLIISASKEYLDFLINLDIQFDIKIPNHAKSYNWILIFVRDQASFENIFTRILDLVAEDGYLWFCFPKKSSKIQTDLTRDSGWEILKDYPNFKWNTLISLDEVWSAFALKKILSKEAQKDKVKPNYEEYIDIQNRIVNIPEDLEKLFIEEDDLKIKFNRLSFTNQKEFVLSLLTAKTLTTKSKRLEIIKQKLIDLA